jgi:hypothetical protein
LEVRILERLVIALEPVWAEYIADHSSLNEEDIEMKGPIDRPGENTFRFTAFKGIRPRI